MTRQKKQLAGSQFNNFIVPPVADLCSPQVIKNSSEVKFLVMSEGSNRKKTLQSKTRKVGTKRQFWELLTTPVDQSRLVVSLPSTYVRRKEEIIKQWCYDLYASRDHKIRRTPETLYLKISGTHVQGKGHIYFLPSFPDMEQNRPEKCKRFRQQLHLPIPSGFHGRIRKNQYVGYIKIFPTYDILVDITNSTNKQTKISGIYNLSGSEEESCTCLWCNEF